MNNKRDGAYRILTAVGYSEHQIDAMPIEVLEELYDWTMGQLDKWVLRGMGFKGVGNDSEAND